MKNKVLCLVVVAVMIVGSFALQSYEPPNNRYHQHLEAQPKAACTDHGEDTFCTHLPLMNITTDAPIPDPYVYDAEGNREVNDRGILVLNDETVSATVEYFDSSDENNHLSDGPSLSERMLFRVRGATSREFDKKNYLMKIKEDNLIDNKDVSFSGMTADNEWALHGPFMDKTLIRNYVCYNLSGEIMDYAPNVRFCELFLNGEYQGVYLIVEKVGYGDNGRINVTQTDPEIKQTSYIVRADRGANDPFYELNTFGTYSYITSPRGKMSGQMEIVYPARTLTEDQHDYIEDDFSKFEKALFSYDYNDPDRGYREYIDVGSFVDYFLINEFTLNYDAVTLSTYLYKDLRGKLTLCVWDFNSAFDNYEYSSIRPETYLLQNQMWYQYLFKDKAFVDRVVERYWELRQEFFSEEYLLAYIDETVEYLGPAMERNYEKWGYSFNSTYNGENYDLLVPKERNVRSLGEAIEQMKGCISQRIGHMDSRLDRLYSLCHESVNKNFNHDQGGGFD